MRSIVAVLLVAVTLAGCADEAPERVQEGREQGGLREALPVDQLPIFLPAKLIDEVRAGGEPVIAQTLEGTLLVAAHPGWTHYHPSEDPTHVGVEILRPASAQSYLWRSTDGGETWAHIGLLMVEGGPRSTGFGVSDPEFTVMHDNTVCYTDLMALATSSVVCSTDDGLTWLPGNELAAGGVNDRQWLASWEDELYFTANYFASTTGLGGHHIRASTDRGLTWEDRGEVPCSQDLVADPHHGHLVVGCGAGIAVSEDAGWTWSSPRKVPDATEGQRVMAEPAIDSAGNIWITWAQGERGLWLAGTPDAGRSWPWVIELTPYFQRFSQTTDISGKEFGGHTEYGTEGTLGAYIWPWISAGSAGRVAVTWIGGFSTTDSANYAESWFFFTAYVIDAHTEDPSVTILPLSREPIHFGPICQGGTFCQVASMQGDDSGDRRLGDFFETTIDSEGYLHAAVSDTWSKREDVISHPLYVRQTGGERLLTDEDIAAGWRPTQG